MASHLDLEEQEQLAELKHFWNNWGNLISGVLIVVLGAYAAWNGWQYWQRQQALKAAVLYDEVERAIQAQDMGRLERSMSDIKDRFGSTTYAHQAALLAARIQSDKGQTEAARGWLAWVAADAPEQALRDIARLRLAALLWQGEKTDEALKTLQQDFSADMSPLAADLRGDVLAANTRQKEAIEAYRQALKGLDAESDYRKVIQAKLEALGVEVQPETRP